MRFWNILGRIFGITFIILLIILIFSWISNIQEDIKDANKRAKTQREEDKRKEKEKRDALPKEEQERITKVHNEGKRRLIGLFVVFVIIPFCILIIVNICNIINDKKIVKKVEECQNYSFNKEIDSFLKENIPVTGGYIVNVTVFYSPREDSCVSSFKYFQVFKSGGNTTESIYRTYEAYGLLSNTKSSLYSMDERYSINKRPEIDKSICKYKSDFTGKYGNYDCDYKNSKGEELRSKEIERLKNI